MTCISVLKWGVSFPAKGGKEEVGKGWPDSVLHGWRTSLLHDRTQPGSSSPPLGLTARTAGSRRSGLRALAHLCRNSWKTTLLGKPWRQMRMPSRTPLQRSWSSTRCGSSLPAWGRKHACGLTSVPKTVRERSGNPYEPDRARA